MVLYATIVVKDSSIFLVATISDFTKLVQSDYTHMYGNY
jgi:hypothetical protein